MVCLQSCSAFNRIALTDSQIKRSQNLTVTQTKSSELIQNDIRKFERQVSCTKYRKTRQWVFYKTEAARNNENTKNKMINKMSGAILQNGGQRNNNSTKNKKIQ